MEFEISFKNTFKINLIRVKFLARALEFVLFINEIFYATKYIISSIANVEIEIY